MKDGIQPKFFAKPSEFRKWLEKNHANKNELFVGFYKTSSGKKSITWPQSVDEALCFGWIDGIRKSIDEESYFIRFTPRKTNSIWSAVNIKKIEELTKKQLMHTAGLEAFKHRKESNSKIYSYEKEPVILAPYFEKIFKANKKAWTFFQSQGSYYRKRATNWIMSAKQEATKISRLQKLIAVSEAGKQY
jgi:uncharacterized protein YdeI (YjbR/CyaY-like superfamily)